MHKILTSGLQWYRRWKRSQALIILPTVATLAGVVGLILGSGAARSFGNLGGDAVVRATALILLIGGVVTLYGMRRKHAFIMTCGLSISAFGASVYGVGTMVGFGTGGIISGLGWVGIALVFLERVVFELNRITAWRGIKEARTEEP